MNKNDRIYNKKKKLWVLKTEPTCSGNFAFINTALFYVVAFKVFSNDIKSLYIKLISHKKKFRDICICFWLQ